MGILLYNLLAGCALYQRKGELMRNSGFVILLSLALVAVFLAGCSQPVTNVPTTPQPTTMAPADTVKVADSPLGSILTDANGMTLYYFITDVPSSGASTCYAAANCSRFWPIFSVDKIVVSPPLEAPDFSSITRTDGTKQTTYYGWPLYYFLNDKAPGDVKGENVLKTWYVAKPDYTVMIAWTPKLGAFLTDNTGKTLYVFNKDSAGASTCTGTCLAKWPAFNAGAVVAPSVLKAADFGAVSRADGVPQTSFMGRPLYYYSGDSGPGATSGQGFNNLWSVANITGTFPVFVTPTPSPTLTATPTVNYYGGSGGGY
jgi:predicted lipoprotein with Yx(FWY)xxD motif